MVAVKGAFGFMMLGLAIWMLSRFLPGANSSWPCGLCSFSWSASSWAV